MNRAPQNTIVEDSCFGKMFDLKESPCTICPLQAECGRYCFEQATKKISDDTLPDEYIVADEYLDLFIVEKKLPQHLLNILK
jgi:hypothetical protein